MAAKGQITHEVESQPMKKQKFDATSQARTWENRKQLEEVDVRGKRNKITYKWAVSFSGESHTLHIQTIQFRINNGHLLCSYYSQLKEHFKRTIRVFQNYILKIYLHL